MEDWVLAVDAAAEVGISKWAIWKAIERGQLAATKIGRQWFIPRREVDRFKAETRKPGRKPREQPLPPEA
jgi:excisionase family DNA binding protein